MAYPELTLTHQLRDRGIENPRVLAAMSKMPRHLFVDPFWQDLAYRDRLLPIDHGQTISQPFIVAYMTQVSVPDKKMKEGWKIRQEKGFMESC